MYLLFLFSLLLIVLLILFFNTKKQQDALTTYEQSQIVKIEEDLEDIKTRIPYFTMGVMESGNGTIAPRDGSCLNNIILDFYLQQPEKGPQGAVGKKGGKGKKGVQGQMGHVGPKGYYNWSQGKL